MGVEVRLLGPPRVLRDGEPVVFDTRKAMALLAHLAMAEHPRPRAALCELLHPGSDPERARGALRRTLSGLRQGIGEEWLDATGDRVALRRGPGFEVDVDRFRAGGPDALGLYAGGFLEGFGLRDSPEFDDWQGATAAALERELVGLLRRAVDERTEDGAFEQALPLARRLLELDPLHEPTHRRLIRLHAWNGDRAAAFEQYRACVRTLSQELGVSPVQETTTLYEQVSDGSLGPPASRSPAPRPAPAGAPEALPLVGRADELDALLAAYGRTTHDGGVVVLEGESGIGKTRLAEELAAHARGEGVVVLTARCFDDEAGLPYGPVVELLRQAAARGVRDVAAAHLAEAARLVPELGEADAAPSPGDPGAQLRLLEAVWAVLGVARVVVVDDVHAADEATLDALAFLGRRLTGRPLLLVLTWRNEAVPPGHRLRRLARDASAVVVRPERLDAAEMAELVDEPGLAAVVHEQSEGLPLFVAEVLAAVRDGAEPVFPAGLLDARLAGLSDVGRQVLGAAAAIGRSFDVDTLRHAGGRGDDETVEALEELVAHGLVRESEGSYDFAHGKLRELAYTQTGLARRRLLHARVAEALAARRPAAPHAALVAHHLTEAGDHAGAAAQHVVAAGHAASVFAHAEALEHVEAALALGEGDVAGLHERAGELLTLLGDYDAALSRLGTAAAHAGTGRQAAIEHRLGTVHHRRGEWDRAASHLDAALAAADPGDHALQAGIRSDLALALHAAGDADRAGTLAAEALALAEEADDLRGRAQAHNLLGVLAVGAGDHEEAVRQLERSLDLARRQGDGQAEVAALNNLALVRRDAGELDASLELTSRALELCSRLGDRHREAALENNLADLHHAAGREDEAMTHLKRAVALFRDVGGEASPQPGVWKLVSW